MKKFKIIFTNGWYIICEGKNNTADISKYNGSESKCFIGAGQLYKEEGGNPVNTGVIQFYEHSIVVIYEMI